MTTKKDRREKVRMKTERFMAELKRSNAETLAKENKHRQHEMEQAWRDNHDKNHSKDKRVKECPLCKKK